MLPVDRPQRREPCSPLADDVMFLLLAQVANGELRGWMRPGRDGGGGGVTSDAGPPKRPVTK